MNSSENTDPAMLAVNPITRRSFMKKTALTVGAITLLGQGVGFANLAGGSRHLFCMHAACDGYEITDPQVYCDDPSSPAKTYFTVGICKCKSGTKDYTTPAWQTAAEPEGDIDWCYPDEKPTLQHTAGHSLPLHATH